MRKDGAIVLTSDELFEQEWWEEIIDNLENTWKIAHFLLTSLYWENPNKNN